MVDFVELRRLMSAELYALAADKGPRLTRRSFVAFSASIPVAGAMDASIAGPLYDVLYDETFFQIRGQGYDWRVDRHYFDGASELTVDRDASRYRVRIPRLRLRGTQIVGALEIQIHIENPGGYELEYSLEPFALRAHCSLKQWLDGEWIPATPSTSLRSMLKRCSILLDRSAMVWVNKNFEILINGQARGDFWGAAANCQSILIRAAGPDSRSPVYPSIEMQGAACLGQSFFPPGLLQLSDLSDSTLRQPHTRTRRQITW